MGYILLEGGAEFGGLMSEPDRLALDLAGGRDVSVRILPTAAAPDSNHARAGANGTHWYRSLGATNVDVVNVIDSASANDSALANELRSAKLIYLLGGFPAYTAQTLAQSRAWQATLDAYNAGAVIAGSSAGAMILCGHFYDPYERKFLNGLNLLPNTCVIPHHKSAPHPWAANLLQRRPGVTLLGIAEQTGMLDDGSTRKWSVSGRGDVTLYRGGNIQRFARGETFSL